MHWLPGLEVKLGNAKFLKKIRNVYTHASNYDRKEYHHGLEREKLDWRKVLDRLNLVDDKKNNYRN
ncbi:MAG: hypothetical protein Q8N88_06995 [Nanoarchaeota archaeon]|nr:hypothetical protein [Nanoarchaeota archaeon]